jgi:hypothetical protein
MSQPLRSPSKVLLESQPATAVPRPASALPAPAEELRSTAQALLAIRLEALFDSAPRELLQYADRAAGDRSRRQILDLMRTLDFERPRLLRSFAHAIGRSFQALPRTAAAIEDDEQAALLGLAIKTTQLTPLALELRDRLAHAARALGAEVSPAALSPVALCQAWAAALEAIDLPLAERLVGLHLFDRHVLSRAAQLYDAALDVLDRHGWRGPDQAAPETCLPLSRFGDSQ